MLQKIKDHRGLVKDSRTGAILNQDREALNDYLEKRSLFETKRKSEEEINSMKEKVESLSNDMAEIKAMLKKVLNDSI